MIRHALLAAAMLTVSASAWAQEGLTLRGAIDEALAKNPAVRSARAGEDEAAAGVRLARSAFLPRVDVVESWQGGNRSSSSGRCSRSSGSRRRTSRLPR
jgi:outer membrane protein TolC